MRFFIQVIRQHEIRSLTREMILDAGGMVDVAAFHASPPGRPVHEAMFHQESSAL
jgi:hypothetical protein